MSQSESPLPPVWKAETDSAKDEQDRGATGKLRAFSDVFSAPLPLATGWRGGRGVR